MKAPREIKRWINRLRKKYGKKNGVVSSALFDSPEYEIKLDKSKKNYKRNQKGGD